MKAWPLRSGTGAPSMARMARRTAEDDFWSYTTGVGLSFSRWRMNSASDFSFCTGRPFSSTKTTRSPSPSKAAPKLAPVSTTFSHSAPSWSYSAGLGERLGNAPSNSQNSSVTR